MMTSNQQILVVYPEEAHSNTGSSIQDYLSNEGFGSAQHHILISRKER